MITKLLSELRHAITCRSTAARGERTLLRRAFADIDANKSGLIDMQEFTDALERFGLHTASHGRGGAGGLGNHVVEALFNYFDADGNGSIEYSEFEEALLQPERPAPPPIINVKPRNRAF